jgi:hypothetical protein
MSCSQMSNDTSRRVIVGLKGESNRRRYGAGTVTTVFAGFRLKDLMESQLRHKDYPQRILSETKRDMEAWS